MVTGFSRRASHSSSKFASHLVQSGACCAVALLFMALGALHAPGSAQAAPADASAPAALKLLSPSEAAVFEALAHGKTNDAIGKLIALLEEQPRISQHERYAPRIERERYGVLADLLISALDRASAWRDTAPALAKLPENPDMLWVRAQCALHMGDEAALRVLEEKLGFAEGWLVCGPFDNERGAGFSVSSPPESEAPDFAAVYTGKSELPVRWRAVTVRPRLGYVDLNAMLRPNDETLAYALTTVTASADCDAIVSLACDEGYRIWINGSELLASTKIGDDGKMTAAAYGRHVHRNCTFDQDVFNVHFFKGTNTILLKITEAEDNWGFRLRVRPEDAAAKLELATPAESETWSKRLQETKKYEGSMSLGGRLDIVAREENDPRVLFWGGAYELFRQSSERKDRVAMNLLNGVYERRAELGAAERAIVTWMLAQASGSTAETKAGAEENRKRELLAETLSIDAGFIPALRGMMDHYNETLHVPAEAGKYARRILALKPGDVDAAIGLARAATFEGLLDEYERVCRELAASKSIDPKVLRFLGYFEHKQGNVEKACEYFTAALKGDPADTYARRRLMEILAEAGDMETFELTATQGHMLAPFDTKLYRERASFIAGLGNEQEAQNLLEVALDISPDDDELLADAARMTTRVADALEIRASEAGLKEIDGRPVGEVVAAARARAMTYYKRALDRNPRRADVKRLLEFLADETPVWEQRLQEDITERVRAALATAPDGQDPLFLVYYDEICRVNPDGSEERYMQTLFRVTNDDGRERLAQYPVQTHEGEERVIEAKVYKQDGSIVPSKIQKVNDRQFTGTLITNPPLDIGDIFHVRHRTASTERSFWGDFFGDIALFGRGVPCGVVRQVYILPQSRKFYFYTRGEIPPPAEVEQDGHRVVTYQMENRPRIEDEPLAPPILQTHPVLHVSTFETWKDFGAWYWNLIQRQLRPTPALTAKVKELTAGLESEEEKVRAVYNWVVKMIRYNSNWEFGIHGYKPYEAGAIFERQIGDCKDKAILSCTMLREVGVKAFPVLVNGEELRGTEDITLPLPHHFNHCIAYVEFSDGKGRFFDGTTTYNAWDEFPAFDAGAQVVVIRPEGGQRMTIPLPTAEQSRDNWTVTLNVEAGGNVEAAARNQPAGQHAANARQWWEQEGRRMQTLERWLGQSAVGAKAKSFEASSLTDLNVPVEYRYEATLPGYARNEGASLTLAPIYQPLRWGRSPIAGLSGRETDLLLPPPFGATLETTVKPPEGYELKDLPAAVDVSSKYLAYSLRFEKTADGIKVSRSWAFTATLVPKDEYPAFRADALKMDAGDATTLTFTKK